MPLLTVPVATAVEVCAEGIDPRLSMSLVRQESNFNPYAIGLDGKAVLKAQPKTYEEAVKTAVNLMREGQGFSVGLAQVHISNIVRYGMTWQEAFDPCANVRTGSKILKGFYTRAVQAGYRENDAVFAALRGFNSGSVDNPVSNGYAKDILNRVSNVVSVPPASSLARIDVSPGRVVPVTAQAVSDDSSPDMFSKPSGSLFTEAESANVLPSDRPVVVAAVATGAKKEASNGEDDRPLMVQATMSP